jgi:hypothetical protein
MNGASTTTGVAESLCRPVVHNRSRLSFDADPAERKPVNPGQDGALACAEKALSEALGSSGFLDVTAPFDESFMMRLNYHPIEGQIEDPRPGVLEELLSLLKSEIAADPKQTRDVQARVPAEAAVRLLK